MGKITKPAHFVSQSYWVVPSTWQSFIENGEMACVTSAWSSRKLGVKLFAVSLGDTRLLTENSYAVKNLDFVASLSYIF